MGENSAVTQAELTMIDFSQAHIGINDSERKDLEFDQTANKEGKIFMLKSQEKIPGQQG